MKDSKKIELIQATKVFVGIDIGKESHYLSMINKDGMILKKGIEIENNIAGLEVLFKILSAFSKDEVMVGVEPTGHYWKALGFKLVESGYALQLINPYHTKLSKELRDNSQTKSDKKDSLLISNLLREGKFLGNRLLTGVYADLRQIVGFRDRVVKDIVRAKIRLINLLDEYLPEYEKSFSEIEGATSMGLLEEFGIEFLRDKQNKTRVVAAIRKISHKAISETRAKELANTWSSSIGVKEGVSVIKSELSMIISDLRRKREQEEELVQQIEQLLSKTDEAEYLMKLSGFAVVTTALILSQTGSFSDFKNAKQIEKFAGLHLVENSSGKRKSKHKISKRGRDKLRYALYLVALNAIKYDVDIRELYRNKIKVQKKNKMVAIVSIMAKLTRMMFGAVRNKGAHPKRLRKERSL